MKRYQVLENGKPADCEHCNVHESWDNSLFDTEEEAQQYAQKWLGHYAALIYWPIPLNSRVFFFGCEAGDNFIEIREIEV